MIERTVPSPRIRQLAPHLVNQIAAGEVIERPASVVKELLENAIDAGATCLAIELEEGGKRSVRVTDDGVGIQPEDLLLAVASHATSKLACEADLHEIHTLGFRGEALASMASVAELELASRPAQQDAAQRVVARDGVVTPVAPEALAPGTRVTVRNLFYNVPARKRFLKTERAELARITALVKEFALALPDVAFTLVNDGRTVLSYPARQQLEARLAEVLGSDIAARLLPLRADRARLRGWIGRPDLARRDTLGIHCFLNGRRVRDRTVLQAVRDAYRGFQIPGQSPIAVLLLEVAPSEVDVNVHPAKLEVRFRDSGAVFRLVQGAVRATLEAAGSVPDLFRPARGAPFSHPASRALAPGEVRDDLAADRFPPAVREFSPGRFDLDRQDPATARSFGDACDLTACGPSASGSASSAAEPATSPAAARGAALAPPPATELVEGRALRVFQVHNAYLIVEEPEGLAVIDQHALHEKILFEDLLAARARGALQQPLLVPEAVALSPGELPVFAELGAALAEAGFEVEDFGAGNVLVRAVPAGFESQGAAELLRVALAQLVDAHRAGAPGEVDLGQRLLATVACKRAVKAGQRLGPAQQLDLVRARARAFHPQNCPHGRPAELFIRWEELERRFERK